MFSNDFEVSEKVLFKFNMSLDQYLKLDRDTKFLLEQAYWELKTKKEENKSKRKVLSIFKRK